jgi:outer membrane receptor protein involved in Fe transport
MQGKLTLMWLRCLALILMLGFGGARSEAQTITGSIRGTVTDPTGAVIAGAQVTARNIDTGVTLHTVSNSSGLYNFQFLVIGNYKVIATSPGFDSQEMGPVQLQIDQVASIDAKLRVGKTSETVSVGATGVLLDTQSSTISTSINSQTLENMPLNGLNVQIATLFVPGSTNPNSASMGGTMGTERDAYSTHGAEPANAIPSFNGNRQQANSYILDGIDINETLNNAIGYNPSPFSIQEVHVITGNADAEFGNVNGGEILMVTKGGTNKFHGDLFEYHEASGLTANSWSRKNNADPAARLGRPDYSQNQFGAAIGGPIFRDKLFFFANFIGLDRVDSGQTTESVPTLAERGLAPGGSAGMADLSGVLSVEGTQVYNMFGTAAQTPYVNNQVPIINPVAKYIFAQSVTHPHLLPLPNRTPDAGTLTGNNFIGKSASSTRNLQGDIRVDYALNNSNTFMGKFSYGNAYDVTDLVPMQVVFPTNNDYPFTNISLGFTHVFSPRIVNNLRAGFTRIVLNQDIAGDPSGIFGLSGDQKVGIPLQNQAIAGFTYMAFGGNGTNLNNWGTAYYTGAFSVDNNFDYNDTLTWVHGNHVTKFGADFVRYQQAFFAPSNLGGQLGVFNYDASFTNYGFADFLTNQAQSAQIAGQTGPFGQRQWRDAVYAQDDWKIRPNLTLNLGLRYSYEQPIYEVNNKMVNVNLALAEFAPAGTPITNMLEYAGANNPATGKTNSRALYNPYYLNLMPRLGFSWSVNPRLVLRGGYGVTDELESTGTGRRLTQNPPYQPSFTNNSTGATGLPAEAGFSIAPGNNTNTNGSSYQAWDPNIHPAIIQQFSLNTQYLLNKNTSLQVGYVGQIGKHLAVPIALNQYTKDKPSGCDAACLQAIIPFNQLVGEGGSVVETASRAISNYNGLQATLQQQRSNGLSYLLNYTLSKSMTNNPGYFGVDGNVDGDSFWQDITNPMGDYGPSNFDARHSLTGIIVYELPFGHGKQFGASWNRLTDEVLGGWQISSNIQINTGYPVAIVASPHCKNNCPQLQTGEYISHANQYRPLKIVNRGRTSTGAFNWFGSDPSVLPCTGRGVDNGTCAYGKIADYGNAHPGTERGPGFQNYDLSLLKSFRVTESQSFKARIDAFNAFNISSYANPGTNTGSGGNFGVIGATRSGPRTLQLSAIYSF